MDYLCNDIFRDLSIDCFASYEAYALSPHMQACIIMTEVVGLSYIAHFFTVKEVGLTLTKVVHCSNSNPQLRHRKEADLTTSANCFNFCRRARETSGSPIPSQSFLDGHRTIWRGASPEILINTLIVFVLFSMEGNICAF